MASSNLLNSVRQFLTSQHMLADNDWIAGCVEFLTEDSDNNYTEAQIQNLAKEQWLLNDLKDICPGCLPSNLCTIQKTILPGRYVLQINSAIDIGTPAYQQYLKLQKVNTENLEATVKYEDKVPNHRMIKLNLTDGVQEISAIEYKPMRNLNNDITPGCKILIKGPVVCRRGMLLLTENVVELLGGEAQEILETNTLAALLSSKLDLPISQEPDLNATISRPRNTDIPVPHAQMPPAGSVTQHFEPISDQHTRPVARVTSLQVANFNDDDIDFGQLDAIEAQFNNSIEDTSRVSSKRSLDDTAARPDKKARTESVNKSSDYPDDCDIFADEDEDYLRELESKIECDDVKAKKTIDGPVAVSAEPFVYLKQIEAMNAHEKAGCVFKVKAQILKLLSKLSVGKDGWSLKCTIVDGTGCLDVEFTSAVLSKLVGFTPQEVNKLKSEMAKKPELKEKLVDALKNAKDTLQVLYCIIELTILEVPKITGLFEYDASHVQLLKRRLHASGL